MCVCVWLKSLKNEFFTRFKPLFSSQNKRKDQRSLKKNSIKQREARREKNPLECYESHVWYLLKQSPLHITQNVKISCQLMIFILFLFQHMIQNYSNMMRGGQTGASPPSAPPQSSKQDETRNWKGPSWCWGSSSLYHIILLLCFLVLTLRLFTRDDLYIMIMIL